MFVCIVFVSGMIGNDNVMLIERKLVRVRISSSTNEGGPKVLLHPPFTINRALSVRRAGMYYVEVN